jgi:hypothetical protein
MGQAERYRLIANKFLPTIKAVCDGEDVPFQVCFAQLVVETGGGKSDLAQRHNYFGLKYPRGKYAEELKERLSVSGKFTKFTPERFTVKDRKHLDKLLGRGAVFSDKYMADPYFGKSVRLKLPCPFCTFDSMEAGIRAWVVWMKKSRYDDGGVFKDDPVRWIAYRWMRGYATADSYVEAVVKRMNRVAEYLGDDTFAAEIDENLDEILDEARFLGPGRERWDLAKEALEANGLHSLPYEVYEFEPMVITAGDSET